MITIIYTDYKENGETETTIVELTEYYIEAHTV